MMSGFLLLIFNPFLVDGSDSFTESINYEVQDSNGAKIIENVARALHVNTKNPCNLMPYVELSSLLVVDQLQQVLQQTGQGRLTASEIAQAKRVYYTLGLFAECATICLLSHRLGAHITARIGLQWISGYHDPIWKANTRYHFVKAFKVGLGNGFRCYTALTTALNNGRFQIPPESVYGPSLDKLKQTLVSFKVKPSDITASIESVALRCLSSTAGLSASHKVQISIALGKSAALFRRMEGSALRKALPDDATVNKLTSLVVDGMLNANYLKVKEKEKRMSFILKAQRDRRVCNTKPNYRDCMVYTAQKFTNIVN